MKHLTKILSAIFLTLLFIYFYSFFSFPNFKSEEIYIKNIETVQDINLSRITKINNIDIREQSYIYIKNEELKNVTEKCSASFLSFGKHTSLSLKDSGILFMCENNTHISYVPVALTVEQTMDKHNLPIDYDFLSSCLKIHFFGYNQGKTVTLFLFMLVFIVYMATHSANVLFRGLLISMIVGLILGMYNQNSNYSPAEGFYKKIEKESGEKIYRSFDFF